MQSCGYYHSEICAKRNRKGRRQYFDQKVKQLTLWWVQRNWSASKTDFYTLQSSIYRFQCIEIVTSMWKKKSSSAGCSYNNYSFYLTARRYHWIVIDEYDFTKYIIVVSVWNQIITSESGSWCTTNYWKYAYAPTRLTR